ncbi:MAG TPA: hypothetical protein VHR39_10805 [Propionibacteriaceae bacterium]|nr:hypothetical protein [Propionibacteriaceae bacterium]
MPTEIVDVEAGFPVPTTVAAVNGVRAGVLPECRAVQAMHVGSYDTLGTTHDAVKQRMREEGLNASDDMWSTTSATSRLTRQHGARRLCGRCSEAIRSRAIAAVRRGTRRLPTRPQAKRLPVVRLVMVHRLREANPEPGGMWPGSDSLVDRPFHNRQ